MQNWTYTKIKTADGWSSNNDRIGEFSVKCGGVEQGRFQWSRSQKKFWGVRVDGEQFSHKDMRVVLHWFKTGERDLPVPVAQYAPQPPVSEAYCRAMSFRDNS
jgi:hypothetical protein